MLVQAFVAQPSIDLFDVGVLVRLAGLDQAQFDPVSIGPGQHGPAGELLAVVGPNHGRLATPCTDFVQKPYQVIAADRLFRNHGHRFMRRVVYDCERFDRTALRDTVEHELHRTGLVGSARTDQRLPIAGQDLLPAPSSDLQLLQCVKPLHALVIALLPGLPKLQVDQSQAPQRRCRCASSMICSGRPVLAPGLGT